MTSLVYINMTHGINTHGINAVPAKMYKTIKELIFYPICNLINGSFSTGVFPDSLKYANNT